MNYKQILDFLFKQLPMYQRVGKAAYKDNLNNTLALDKYFNFPHKNFKSIHIAGTNGKGSVAHILASVLHEQKYKVGLYTSPHLKDFRERIKINGQMIQENEVIKFVENNSTIIEGLKPSFFEITVAMAFYHFAKQEVDIAVIEVGMGGRLDSTNIVTPLVSVITNIGYDHTQFLGDTLEKIAIEKAGIIKKNVPLVIGKYQKNIADIFTKKAKEKSSEIYFSDNEYKIDYSLINSDSHQVFNVEKNNETIKYENLKLDLLGQYQIENTLTALKTIDILNDSDIKISDEAIYKGFKNVVNNTGLSGRWQIIANNPLIVCDTAHNKEGLTKVFEQIKNTAYKNLHIVFGTVNDKNIEGILNILPINAKYYFTKANIPRALDEQILFNKAKQIGLKGEAYSAVKHAITAAKLNADKNDLIFVGGSTFVVAEVI